VEFKKVAQIYRALSIGQSISSIDTVLYCKHEEVTIKHLACSKYLCQFPFILLPTSFTNNSQTLLVLNPV